MNFIENHFDLNKASLVVMEKINNYDYIIFILDFYKIIICYSNIEDYNNLDSFHNKDKFILYYYPSKNINFPPFEYKFYIQDNSKYSIKNDIKVRGKHIKINTDSNSITASYFNNKKIGKLI